MRSWFRPSTSIPLDEQLARLSENGVQLRPGMSSRDVRGKLKLLKAEGSGYPATLSGLGAVQLLGDGHATFLSDDVWYFDAACISGPGTYAFVVTRLAQMLPNEFPARNADDSIRIEDWRASVSFDLGEERLHWTQRVLDTWLDETLFVRINQLIDKQGDGWRGGAGSGASGGARHLWQVPLPGRQRLIVAATAVHGRRLAQVCGLALRKIV